MGNYSLPFWSPTALGFATSKFTDLETLEELVDECICLCDLESGGGGALTRGFTISKFTAPSHFFHESPWRAPSNCHLLMNVFIYMVRFYFYIFSCWLWTAHWFCRGGGGAGYTDTLRFVIIRKLQFSSFCQEYGYLEMVLPSLN